MDVSIFNDKNTLPDDGLLSEALHETYPYWITIREFVKSLFPAAMEEWHYPGTKYGWSFRMKDKKRTIIYLLPREGYFMVAFVFGQKVFEMIMRSNVNQQIKSELASARRYAEGRGLRIEVKDPGILPDIRSLIDMKVA